MSDSFHVPDATSLSDQGNGQNGILDFDLSELFSPAVEHDEGAFLNLDFLDALSEIPTVHSNEALSALPTLPTLPTISQNWDFPSPLSSGVDLSPQHTVYETPPSQPVTPASFEVSGDLPNPFVGDATDVFEVEPNKHPENDHPLSAGLPFIPFDDYVAQLPYLGPSDPHPSPAPSGEHVLRQSIQASVPYGHTMFSESGAKQLLGEEFPLAPPNHQAFKLSMQVPVAYSTCDHALFLEPGTEHRYREGVPLPLALAGPSRGPTLLSVRKPRSLESLVSDRWHSSAQWAPMKHVELLGPFVPQTPYHKSTTMEEKLGEVAFKLRDPIEFKSNGGTKGIALKEANPDQNLTLKLEDARKPIFDDDDESVRDTVSLRLEWPGYSSFQRQFSLKTHQKVRIPVSKSKLVREIHKSIESFIKKVNDTREECTLPEWKVGPNGIQLNDLILTKFVHVSKGSWQPEVRLCRPLGLNKQNPEGSQSYEQDAGLSCSRSVMQCNRGRLRDRHSWNKS